MKKFILTTTLLAVSSFAFADDSVNKGVKFECMMSQEGPSKIEGDYIMIDTAKANKPKREKTTVLATKNTATMFTGKSIIGGWSPKRTDIDNGTALYRNQDIFMSLDAQGEYGIEVILPDNTILVAYNCKVTWLEN